MKWLVLGLMLCGLASAQAQGLVPRPTVAITTGTSTVQLLAPQSNGIQVTGVVLQGAGGNVQFLYGTGALCATNPVLLTGIMPMTVNGLVVGNGGGVIMSVPPNQALCVSTSVASFGWMSWAQ